MSEASPYSPGTPPTQPETQDSQSSAAASPKPSAERDTPPLRVWPAVVLLAIMAMIRFGIGAIEQPSLGVMATGFIGPAVVGLMIVVWWLTFSRAGGVEKIIGITVMAAIVAGAVLFSHPSMVGMGTMVYQWPTGIALFAAGAVAMASRSSLRLPVALIGLALGMLTWNAVRMTGTDGKFNGQFASRFSPTDEELYLDSLERVSSKPAAGSEVAASQPSEPDGPSIKRETAPWPDFRGAARDSVVTGVTLSADWQNDPPRELWRRRIGPGWSSFTVADGRLFTQEQRGEDEATVCLDAQTGQTIWTHQTEGRFWEAVAGAGPRATPTIGPGVVYSMGAAGSLSCLDAATGREIWIRDINADSGRIAPPQWGYASSPLYLDTDPPVVVIHAGETRQGSSASESNASQRRGIIAYDAVDGSIRWTADAGDHTYASPQRAVIQGTTCILMVDNDGIAVYSTDGRVLGRYSDPAMNYRTLQPLVAGNDVLLSTPLSTGVERLTLSQKEDSDEIEIQSVWYSTELKPDFNDMVLFENHLYGFDGNIFACVDFETGRRIWKRGRYGNGQVVLLADDGQLLIITEKGRLILAEATPERLVESARFDVLDGKTWNHPVIVGDRLYVRNASHAAAFELTPAETSSPGDESSPGDVVD